MALTKERKEEIVEAYPRGSPPNVAIWANYRGVKAQQFEPAQHAAIVNAEMMVVKNTLMRVASSSGPAYDDKMMEGSAVTFVATTSPPRRARVTNFARQRGVVPRWVVRRRQVIDAQVRNW